uniref:Transposase Tc1-like domain-containing protein n=1 Tax=Ditylenchus dipsaci TaxID=166011 RepID=A0A915DUY8_9BILA
MAKRKKSTEQTNTVNRIVNRFEEEGSVSNRQRSGDPRKTSARDDRRLVKIVKDDPRKTATDVRIYANNNLSVGITTRTARLILEKANLPARRPSKKPLISEKNVKSRLEFARKHFEWSVADLGRVLWSVESKYKLLSSNGIRYVRRPPGQRNNPKYQVPTVKHGGGSVMVWGSFSRDGWVRFIELKEFMKAVNYKKILEEQMLPDARTREMK